MAVTIGTDGWVTGLQTAYLPYQPGESGNSRKPIFSCDRFYQNISATFYLNGINVKNIRLKKISIPLTIQIGSGRRLSDYNQFVNDEKTVKIKISFSDNSVIYEEKTFQQINDLPSLIYIDLEKEEGEYYAYITNIAITKNINIKDSNSNLLAQNIFRLNVYYPIIQFDLYNPQIITLFKPNIYYKDKDANIQQISTKLFNQITYKDKQGATKKLALYDLDNETTQFTCPLTEDSLKTDPLFYIFDLNNFQIDTKSNDTNLFYLWGGNYSSYDYNKEYLCLLNNENRSIDNNSAATNATKNLSNVYTIIYAPGILQQDQILTFHGKRRENNK